MKGSENFSTSYGRPSRNDIAHISAHAHSPAASRRPRAHGVHKVLAYVSDIYEGSLVEGAASHLT